MARPTKRTPEARKIILEALEGGNYRVVAARLAGLNPDTFFEWVRIDAEFSEACKAAEAKAEREMVEALRANERDGAKEWLGRKYPKRWGRRDKVDATVTHDLSKLSDAELDARAVELAQRVLHGKQTAG